jgi:hypothetical protein
MSNIGQLKITEGIRKQVVYDLTKTERDIIDTLYPLQNGSLGTFEEAKSIQEAIRTNQGVEGITGNVTRTKSIRGIPKKNIKSVLIKETGDNQESARKAVDILWRKGFKNPLTKFQY